MTKEKIDMTNEHNFKVGDYARIKCNGRICRVDIADEGTGLVGVIEYPKYANTYSVADIESLDRRTAFLTRLQSLLREFDAEIIFHCDYKQEMLATSIIVGESELRQNEIYGVTADNIMDFDKEGV